MRLARGWWKEGVWCGFCGGRGEVGAREVGMWVRGRGGGGRWGEDVESVGVEESCA